MANSNLVVTRERNVFTKMFNFAKESFTYDF